MRREVSRLLSVLVVAAAAVCCGRQRIIPDQELAMIFREAFLANSYVSNNRIKSDTVDVYGPIFSKYGYTVEDVQYTIGNFSKRKSARLSDVVNMAMTALDEESGAFRRRVAALDSVDAIARRRFAKVVYTDTLLRIRKVKDTTGMILRIPVAEPGDYEVAFRYALDSADRNNNLRFDFYMLSSAGRHRSDVVYRLKRDVRESYKRSFAADTSIRFLVLDLNPYGKKFENPGLRIDTLVVKRYLPADKGMDSLYRSLFDYAVPVDYYNYIDIYAARRDSANMVQDSLRTEISADTVRCDSICAE